MKRIIRFFYRLRYGVSGAIKPPLGFSPFGPRPSLLRRAFYRFRVACWRFESRVYDWTGLPAQWHGAYFNMPFSA